MRMLVGFGLLVVGRVGWASDKTYDCTGSHSLQHWIDHVGLSGGTVTVKCATPLVLQEDVVVDGTKVGPVTLIAADGTDFTLSPVAEGDHAIYLTTGGTLSLEDFTIACPTDDWTQGDNLVLADGSSTLSLTDMKVRSCAGVGSVHGSGVRMDHAELLTVNTSLFSGEPSDAERGGGIYLKNTKGVITQSVFIDGTALTGGAVYCKPDSTYTLTLSHNLFIATSSATEATTGQFVYNENCTLNIENNVFLYESSDLGTEAIYFLTDSPTITNNLFLNIPTPVATASGVAVTAQTNACDTKDACTSLTGSLPTTDLALQSVDMTFLDLDLSAYALWPTYDSPLRDAGTFSGALGCGRADIGLTGGVDGTSGAAWWPDVDLDGSGDTDSDCWPEIYDCDDDDVNINERLTRYADVDGDGFGGEEVQACPADASAVDNAQDCDDSDSAAYPDGDEVCDDRDNDCDGTKDEDLPTNTYYTDSDQDGFGAGNPTTTCDTPPEGSADNATDCDDTNPSLGAEDTHTWYIDRDGDGFGASTETKEACGDTPPAGYTTNNLDCNDADPTAHPGGTEEFDEVDHDCDGYLYPALKGAYLCGCATTPDAPASVAALLLLALAATRRARRRAM